MAALVPIGDLELLEQIEAILDSREAALRIADPDEAPIPYERVRKELDLA